LQAIALLSHAEAQRRKGRKEESDRFEEIFQAMPSAGFAYA